MALIAETVRGKTLRSKAPCKVKRVLASSYSITWPELQKGDDRVILDEIKRQFPPLLTPRCQVGGKSSPGNADDKNTIVEENKKRKKEIKLHLCIGINEVTRCLEHGKLQLLLVCRSAKPCILTNHLILLSASRATPACALHGLSQTLAPLLGIKTVIACGFKKTENKTNFDDLVDFISKRCPKIDVPWLNIWNKCENAGEIADKTFSESKMKNNSSMSSGNTCGPERVTTEDSGTQKVFQDENEEATIAKKETKKRKLQDVSVEYQKINVKTLKCKEGKMMKRKTQKVKKKPMPLVPDKKTLDSSDDNN